MMHARVVGDFVGDFVDEINEDLLPVLEEIVNETVDDLAAEVTVLLSTPGEPIPGAPPRKQAGDLIDALRKGKAKRRGYGRVEGYVANDDPGAGMLEFGGTDKRGIYHPPHPYWRPAEENIQPKFDERMNRI